jgi:hypothetical protein
VTHTDSTLLPFYSFDTSAILNGRRDLFMPETFGSVWAAIEGMIATGQVRAVDEVKRELDKKSDEAHAWAKQCKGLFVPLDHDIQKATRTVLAESPRLLGLRSGPRNGADPFVIGLALARQGTVVTQETLSGSDAKPRMPDVCEALGVPWMTLPQFINLQGWSLSLG